MINFNKQNLPFFKPKKNKNNRLKGLLALFMMVIGMQVSWGQASITSSTAVTDALTASAGASAPTNWTMSGNTTFNGTAQTTNTAGGWYGNGNISFLGSGSASNGNATWLLQNNSGSTLTGFTLAFTARLWKTGTSSPSVTVSYSNSGTITNPATGALTNALSSLTFNDATTNVSTGAAMTQTVSGLTIANGQYIFVRFIHAGGSSSDNLGWDDCSFTPTLAVSTNYYSKSAGNLETLSNWGTATDGTGTAPTDFTSANQVFNIRNNATPTIGAAWTVSGTNSKIIVGDGTNGCNFTIPALYAVIGTVDVAAAATLTLQHLTTFPTFGTLNATGTIVFDGNGTQTIPTGTYPNLKVQNSAGIKTLGGNIVLGNTNTLTVAASTILDAAAYTITYGTSGTAAINGTLRTANTNGFSGAANTTIVSTNTPTITLGTSSTIVYNAALAQAVTSRTYANLQISNSGAAKTPGGNITLGNSNTFTLDAGVTYTAGAFTMTFGTGGTATINGIFQTANTTTTTTGGFSGNATASFVSTNTPTINLNAGSTVEYNRAGAQTITSLAYYNLTISNTTGTKTFASGPSLQSNGTLLVNSGVTADMGTTQMSFGTGCTVTINGTLNTSKALGGLSGSASSVFDNTNTPSITLGSASTINYNGTGNQVISAIQYANLTIGGTRASTPVITLSSGTIQITGVATNAISGAVTWSNTSNTVDYNGTGNQTIAAFNYNNLTISGARSAATITLPAGTIDVVGTFSYTATGSPTISPSTSTVNFSSASPQTIPAFTYNTITNTGNGARTLANGTILVAGTFTPGSGNYTIGTSTVEFNGSAAQTIPVLTVASGGNYYNLTYSGTGTTTSAAVIGGSISVANDFTVANTGTVGFSGSNAYTLSIYGNLVLTDGTFEWALTSSAATSNISLKGNIIQAAGITYTTTTNATNGTINFSGSGTVLSPQTISLTSNNTFQYTNLNVNSATVVQVNNSFILTGSTTAAYIGSLTVNGTLNLQGNTVTSSAASAAFTINALATLITSISGGIEAAIPSSNMNRTFTAGANYTFNGTTTTAFPTTAQQASFGNPANITTAANISLNRPVTMSGTLTLGGILTTTATNTLTLTNTANTAISGASATAFINGPVTWTLGSSSTGTYTVPVGVTSAYYPMAFAAGTIASGSPTINVQAFATGVSTADGTTLSTMSGNEYWKIITTGTNFAASSFSLGRSTPALGTLDAIGKSTTNATLSYSKIGGTVGTLSGQPGIITSSSGLSGASTLYLSLAKIAGPVITGTATATAFTTTYGTPSTPQTFSINGYNLTADIVATAPTGFEVSTDGVTYGSTATFIQSSGSVSGSLRVRYTATAAVGGTYNGQTISLASTDATTKYITTASTGNSITAKALTMSGLSVPTSKVYDGSTAAVVTDAKTLQADEAFGTGSSSDGKPYTGDAVSITGTAFGTYNNKNVASATAVTYSGLSLTGAAAGNYSLTIQGTSAATITTKALTMSGLSVPASKTYDGGTTAVVSGTAVLQTAQAVGAGNTSDGKPYTGDVVSIIGTAAGTYDTKDVSTASTVTFSGLSLTGAQATNYSLTQGNSAATITTKSLTISGLTADNKNYDGTTTATLSGTPSLVGVVSADASYVTLGGVYSANFSTSAVGIALPVTVTGYTISGSANTNYSLTQPSGLTADITSATITGASTATAFTTTYGTASTPQSFAVSGSGLTTDITATAPTGFQVSSDGTTYGTAAAIANSGGSASGTIYIKLAANAPVTGSYNSSNIVLSSTGASNVNITTAASGNTVSPKALTMSGLSVPASKEYNRNTTAVVTDSKTLLTYEAFGVGSSSDGKPYTGDVVSITGTPVGTYNTKDVATATTVTYSGLSLTGAAAGNYSLTIQSTSAATITAKGLTVTGASVTSKIYTGTNNATITGATLSGVISPDAVTLVAGSNTFNSMNVANGISITTNYSLSGADASNYSITQPTLTGNITTATLTIINVSGVSRAYDGSTTATVTGTPAYSGLVSGDVFGTVSGSPTFSFSTATAANGKSITIGNGGYTAPSGNYSVTQPTLTANITKVPLTITAADQSVAYATPVATVTGAGTYTPTGFVNSETASVIGGSATYSTTYTIATAVGSTVVTITPIVSGLTATNYSFTAATGTITVIKANQTITFAATASATTTTADYAPGATSASSATNPITYASSNAAVATIVSGQIHIVGVGTATITASQAASANYNAAADVTQTLTVTVNTDVFRSFTSGNWNTAGTWQSAATTAGPFATATTTPGANNPVYIQSGHTVTLTQNESVNDLHIASGTSSALGTRGIVALSTFTLSVNGKLRDYYGAVGTVPGTNQNSGYSAYPFTAGSGGKVSIVGNSRTVFTSGEWGATVTTTSTNFPLEINMNAGQTATANTSIKCSNLNVVAGTLDAAILGIDNGTPGQGDATIAVGATIKSSATSTNNVFQKTGGSLAGTLTVNGTLVLTGATPLISMTTIAFNGTVEYSASGTQTLAVSANSGASPNTYTNIKLSGTSAKSLGVNTTVNGTLTIAGTASLALNANTLTYGGSSTLEYAGSAAQTTSTAAELSAIPPTVKINNTSGVSLGQSVAINALNLIDGTTLSIGSNTLTLNGTFTGTGKFVGSSSSNLTIGGSGSFADLYFDQTTSGTTNVLKNLTISGSNTITLGNTLNISAGATPGIVTVGSGSTLNTGGNLTLKSDASGTASIGNSAGSISGNVTIERYIPATRRAYRFLASPVTTSNIYDNWQESGTNAANKGIQITGIAGPSPGGIDNTSGLDITQNGNYSMFTCSASTWNAITNTKSTALTPGVGYRVMVRGDRLYDLFASPAPATASTVIKATGILAQGDVTIATLPIGYNLVGNPYASEIDWDATGWSSIRTSANISNALYIYKPGVASSVTANASQYATYSGGTSTNGGVRYIASGQSFFVQVNSGTPNLIFKEIYKTNTAVAGFFKTSTQQNHLRIEYIYNSEHVDEMVLRFKPDATLTFDNNYDANSLNSEVFGICSIKDTNRLAIQTRPDFKEKDIVTLSLRADQTGDFQLKFTDIETFDPSISIALNDKFLHKIINLTNNAAYNFQITADPASKGENRFEIQFTKTTTGINNLNSTTSKQFSLFPNPASSAIYLAANFQDASNNAYTIYNQLGMDMQNGNLKLCKIPPMLLT